MSRPAPVPPLRACVVVPARNEEALIGRCIRALASQQGVRPDEYEVVLVLDACTDRTRERALEAASGHPALRLRLLDGPGRGAGHARRLGMETACERLYAAGNPDGLIASTDADSVVDRDWLVRQLELSERHGALAIGGRIELYDPGHHLPENVRRWWLEQGRARQLDLLHDRGPGPGGRIEHWQFSGASLSLRASVYRKVGGMEPLAALEDEQLERALRDHGIPIERPLSVRVRTSARLSGRAVRGLSRDLALAFWTEKNTLDGGRFTREYVLRSRSHRVTLIWDPTTGASDAGPIVEAGLVDEAIPLSITGGTGCGLRRALQRSTGEIVVLFSDGGCLSTSNVCRLIGPLEERDDLALVKGALPATDDLTELLARPLISLHFPQLAGFVDPLSMNLAARRGLLERLPLPAGEGVRLSLLVDASREAGVHALAQTRLDGTPSSPAESQEVAYALLAAAARRTRLGSRETDEAVGPLLLPGAHGPDPRRVIVDEYDPLSVRNPATEARPSP
ncbi:glycosyltransferase family 2 protein [Rubrobacter calidifluminis]|uniref:glycosyltransferase family 2 protein n=1 Tax=Rubrobacter calidifluminis TaxID=1392640 RepID=UPI002360AA6E|nr:glycosyltransferase family 2 protein [Rubrobacter calidifluminis]